MVGIDNPLVANNAPAVLFCPSDPETRTHFSWSPNDISPRPNSPDVPKQPYALLNYLANFNILVPGRDPNSLGKTQGFGALTDGTSNTVLFAEAHRLCDNQGGAYGVRMTIQAKGDYHHHCFGIDSLPTPRPNTYMFQSTPRPSNCDNWRVQAMHPGTLIVAFADNHARGIKNTISRSDMSNADNTTQLDPDPYDAHVANPKGSWDMLLLPGDGGTPSFD